MNNTSNISTAAAALGRKGGKSTTEAKTSAARANGAKGGRKLAHNTTDQTRWSVIQTGPTTRVLGHYDTREAAEAARGSYLSKPWGSGIGPIVQIHEMAPGEYLRK